MKNIVLYFLAFLVCIPAFAQLEPTLPNTSSINPCFPDISKYTVKTVSAAGGDFTDLQSALNSVQSGTVLVLTAGETYRGSFLLPVKSGDEWIIITSSAMMHLPKQETRISPTTSTGNSQYSTQVDAMPKIMTVSPAGVPCFQTEPGAHHYRLVGLEITIDTSVHNSYGLVHLGTAGTTQNFVASIPHDLIIDRCYIHGHTNATVMKAGVLLNCANSAVLDSYISDFHSIGNDTYAIGGTNGPGPFKIINNYLEAAGENILFGGAAPAMQGLVPSDIEVRNNYFYKPLSWRVGHATYAGKHWTIKNLFELKTGVRVLLDGNILENCWADLPIGQSGYAILLTVRAEGGASPQADVSDITITNNIVRHAGAGISLSGHDDQALSNQSRRIKIANNLFEDIDGAKYGDLNVAGPNDGVFIKLGDPSDVIIDHNTVFQTGAITWAGDTVSNFVFTNNMMNCKLSAGKYQGMYGPGFARGGNAPMAKYFPEITDANQRFNRNVFIGGDSVNYSNYTSLSKNYFPPSSADVQFIDYANGSKDYRTYALSSGSGFKNKSTDGKDIGVDMARLIAAQTLTKVCTSDTTVSAENPPNTPQRSMTIYPNPVTTTCTLDLGEMPHGVGYSVRIVNIVGQEVMRLPARTRIISLDMTSIKSAGVYRAQVMQTYGMVMGECAVVVVGR